MMHVYPLDDIYEHDTEGTGCACQPKIEIVSGELLVIHNSWDGREFLEPQEVTAADIERLEQGHAS